LDNRAIGILGRTKKPEKEWKSSGSVKRSADAEKRSNNAGKRNRRIIRDGLNVTIVQQNSLSSRSHPNRLMLLYPGPVQITA
jgi:hypothetical protein